MPLGRADAGTAAARASTTGRPYDTLHMNTKYCKGQLGAKSSALWRSGWPAAPEQQARAACCLPSQVEIRARQQLQRLAWRQPPPTYPAFDINGASSRASYQVREHCLHGRHMEGFTPPSPARHEPTETRRYNSTTASGGSSTGPGGFHLWADVSVRGGTPAESPQRADVKGLASRQYVLTFALRNCSGGGSR